MVVNQKEKKDKSKNNKKQVQKGKEQNKESKTLRLIKERKRKAQLRTNPALSIYESGRERTKRVVKKEYPLVNINKLPSILTKGNDNIGVVWKNTNKIQSHTLFATTNLPSREPASKNDIFYLVAPFKEPKTVDILEEFKKCKINFANENKNRYKDIKSKIEKPKVQSTKSIDTHVNQIGKKTEQKIDNLNKFDVMDNTYEESIKKNFIPLISSFSTNPLTKNRFISEMGLDKASKGNNDQLHKVNKKKIYKSKSLMQNKMCRNDNLYNNFDTIINSIQPLDSIISAKPISVNNSLIANQNVNIPNIDFFDDSIDFKKVKKEEVLNEDLIKVNSNEYLLGEPKIEKFSDDNILSNLLKMNENESYLNSGLNQKLANEQFINEFDITKSFDILDKPIFNSPKPHHSGSLDEILAPFKVSVSSPNIKLEPETINKKNGFSAFSCFNFDDMDLPKVKLPQDLNLLNDDLMNSNIMNNEIIKKDLPSPPRERVNYGGLGEIAKFSTNIIPNKLKSVKMEEIDLKPKNNFDFGGFDENKVKKEDTMTLDFIGNNSPYSSLTNFGNNTDALLNINDDLLTKLINSNENELMNIDAALLENNNLLQNDCNNNTNIPIDCYNTEMNFVSSPYLLPNSLDYSNNELTNVKSKSNFLPSPEAKLMKELPYNTIKSSNNNIEMNTICDINAKSKNEFIQGCCANEIPLAITTATNLRTIPDWYNQNEIDLINNTNGSNSSSNSPQLIKPLAPTIDSFIPDSTKEMLNDETHYDSILDTNNTLPYEDINKEKLKKDNCAPESTKMDVILDLNVELSDNIIEEIIDRLANDDQLKDKSSESCFAGCTLQETGKLMKKISKELEQISLKSSQLENSEKKWKEWRKEILAYEDEAHQWLNARIEFYSRRVNEYRKDWIEYWIKRYLMQQKQQIKSLSYYINIPQNLQFASCTTTTNSTVTTTNIPKTSNESETINSEQCTERTTTTSLVAVTADVNRDPRLEVIGRTIEVANKELLNNPAMIEEYHEKLLIEKKLLLEKYDIVDSLDLVPTDYIEPITNLNNSNLVNINEGIKTEENTKMEGVTSTNTPSKYVSIDSVNGGSKGFKSGRKDKEEIASVLIDEYVKAPFESKRIFIHGIPKDYQLMFNDKMKSLIFILDKCIQDKKDLYHTMEENRKQYSILNEKNE